MTPPAGVTRRGLFMKIGIFLNGIVAVILGVPIVRYLLSLIHICRPILLGGVIAPILWTGLLHSILDLINPLLNAHIDWPWFVASQFAFGIVAGLVVVRQQRVRIRQFVPFLMRAGFEAPGITKEKPEQDGSR